MNKPTFLVLIADSHEAKIFEKVGKKQFDLNFVSKLEADLDNGNEKPGRGLGNTGSMVHATAPHADRHQVEKHHFAEKISKAVADLDNAKNYEGLILIASHKILEELNHTLSKHLQSKVTYRLAKNLHEFSTEEIKKYISEHLYPQV